MKMNFLNWGALLLALGFASCSHDGVYDPDAQKDPVKVADLEVPADFTWEMSKNVAVSISAPVESMISIYADEKCQTLLAELPVGTESEVCNLSVDLSVEQLYVQYQTKAGQKAVKAYSLQSTKTIVDDILIKLPEDIGKWEDYAGGYMTYPQAAWGTLLFEDMWPNIGDYDFNDLSAWYKIQLEDFRNGHKFWAINMGVRLNALGGKLPYQLCLQIDDLDSEEIEGIECMDREGNDIEGVLVWDSKGKKGPAIFSFDWKNKKGSNGGNYFNTEIEHEVATAELDKDQINVIITLGRGKKLSQVTHSSFNFFIRKEDGTEIHLKGYQPTDDFKDRYDEIVKENPDLNPCIPYCSNKNLVWGIKVPNGIDHAVEKVNFTKAYPQFAGWVQSNGRSHVEWYFSSNKISANCISVNN